MKTVEKFEAILASIKNSDEIDRHCESNGLPEDFADALHLYTEYKNNHRIWPMWMRKEYENQIGN